MSMKKQTDQCSKCILPVGTKNVEFDENGVCHFCRYDKKYKGDRDESVFLKEILDRRLARIREKGRDGAFDCLVGVSGGRDSTFLMYQLKKKHGLRVLAAYYRTPFTPDVIDGNVRRIAKELDVPLEEIKISRREHISIAKTMLEQWKIRKDPIYANIACAPCKMLNGIVYKIARKHKIKAIVFGGNPWEMFEFGPASVYLKSKNSVMRLAKLNMLREAFGGILKGVGILMKNPIMFKYLWVGFKATVLYKNPHTVFLRFLYPDIHCMDYFYYYPWCESEILGILSDLGWAVPDDCNTTWRSDCAYAEIKNLIFKDQIGATMVDALLSNMVRGGILSRDEALSRIVSEGKISKSRVKTSLKILGLPESFLDEEMKKN